MPVTLTVGPPPGADPAGLLLEAAGAAKCAACGCAHETSAALAGLPDSAPPRLRDAAGRLSESLTAQRYPCLGCTVCWPAEALGLVQEAGLIAEEAVCPAKPVEPRPGWPPLPGDYTVLRYTAPVAVCTLGDSDLAAAVRRAGRPGGGDHRHADHREPRHRTAGEPTRSPTRTCGSSWSAGRRWNSGSGTTPAAASRAGRQRHRRPGAGSSTPPAGGPGCATSPADEIAHFRTHVEVIDLIGTQDPRCGPRHRQGSVQPATPARRPSHRAASPRQCAGLLLLRARSPTRRATWSCTPTRGGCCW